MAPHSTTTMPPQRPYHEENLLDGDSSDPIAITGFDFTFPGDAVSEEKLWEMLVNGLVNPATLPGNRFTVESSSSGDEATAWTVRTLNIRPTFL